MVRPRARRLWMIATLLGAGLVGARIVRADYEAAKRQFQEHAHAADWKERRDAYRALTDHDGGPAATLILQALGTESHPAVVAGAMDVVGQMRSSGAKEAILAALAKGRPSERLLAVRALAGMLGADVDTALLAQLASGPPQIAAQAALALGRAGRASASGPLILALASDAWQVRVAVAKALAALGDKAALQPLVERLKTDRGRARAEEITALELLTGRALGDSPLRWAAVAAGSDPNAIDEKPLLAPTFFGVPVTGERVVFVLDRSLNMKDAHPFLGPEQQERLKALCSPVDGERIPWRAIKTKLQLALAHLRHAVDGLPPGTRFEVLYFAADVQGVFGKKWAVAAGATKKTLDDALGKLEVDDGINLYEALLTALDLGGSTEDKAWKGGPDQVFLVTNNMATASEVKDPDAITAAIALRAGLRMVPITTVGIGNHPFTLAEGLATKTGGRYVNLTK